MMSATFKLVTPPDQSAMAARSSMRFVSTGLEGGGT
jgi:hypothetical protein